MFSHVIKLPTLGTDHLSNITSQPMSICITQPGKSNTGKLWVS